MLQYDPPITIIKEEFINRFPDFLDITNLETVISVYYNYFTHKWEEEQWQEAILFLIGHLQTLMIKSEDNNDSSFTASKKQVDGVSVTFAMPIKLTGLETWYSSTFYGQVFFQLTASQRMGGLGV